MAAQGTISGAWKRTYVDYSGAAVWGTGINPIHYYYGSGALRPTPYPLRTGEITPPWQSVPEQLQSEQLWGYTVEDTRYTGMEYDDRPRWGDCTYDEMTRASAGDQPSWEAPQQVNESFRGRLGGAYRKFRGRSTVQSAITYQIPSETVSEGWRNKPQGSPADAKPSDDKQLIVQTSMTQRYETRDNRASVVRGTDRPRAPIASKVTGQRLKIYSGGMRHYDMEPKVQDQMPRPFWFRTAGTGRRFEMVPNTLWSISPIQRIPPGDQSMGDPETQITSDWNYTDEDAQYYG